jgi:hypothetical protein
MTLDREEEYAGMEIRVFQAEEGLQNPETVIPHLCYDWDVPDADAMSQLTQLLQQPDVDRLVGLSIGMWAEEMYDVPPTEILEALIAAAPQLPNLKILFFGNMGYDENEVSWIEMSDLSPIWAAFPQLERFRIRGSNDLTLGKIEHDFLKELIIECGGLPVNVLNEIAAAKLPALEHLELFLGTDNYGWNGTINDVEPLLNPDLFPKLTYLGLKDSEIQDEVAELVVKHPAMLEKLDVLDMSLGTLSSRGGRALLESDAIRTLKHLNLERHYMTTEVMNQFKQLGIDVNVDDQQDQQFEGNGDQMDGDWDERYVAVGE